MVNLFILLKKKKKNYYHIYFNNCEEEIKRNFIKNYEKISNIKIIIDYQVESFNELFNDCKCIKSIYFKNLIEAILKACIACSIIIKP